MTLPRIPNIVWPRNFKDWTSQMAIDAFGLQRNDKQLDFVAWRDVHHSIPPKYEELVEMLRLDLTNGHTGWNEVELMMHFIGPFLKYIAFGGIRYGLYFNRKLQVKVDTLVLSGTVDGVIALGYDEPIHPYFFLREYKKSQGNDSEPFGQLLSAMVAAQQLNNDGQPLYGCYVIGKYWTFVLLAGDQYAVTQGYDATDAGELQIIWSMLVEVKRIVEERVERLLAQTE